MTTVKLKTFAGVDIHADEKGKFSATLPTGARKQSSNLREIENFITSYTPQGKIELWERGYSDKISTVTVTGIAPPERRSKYSSSEPQVITGKSSSGVPRTRAIRGLYWPDPELLAELQAARDEFVKAQAAWEAKYRELAGRMKPATIEEVTAAFAAQQAERSKNGSDDSEAA